MTIRRGAFVAPLLMLVTAAGPAMALNWVPLMKNTAFERFDEDDLEMFIQTGRKALGGAPDNQTVSWDNPDTKAGGDFTILKSWRQDGLDCKQVRVRTHAGGRKGDAVVNACQVKGKWKLTGAPRKMTDKK